MRNEFRFSQFVRNQVLLTRTVRQDMKVIGILGLMVATLSGCTTPSRISSAEIVGVFVLDRGRSDSTSISFDESGRYSEMRLLDNHLPDIDQPGVDYAEDTNPVVDTGIWILSDHKIVLNSDRQDVPDRHCPVLRSSDTLIIHGIRGGAVYKKWPNKPAETTSVARPEIRKSSPFAATSCSEPHG